MISDSFIRKNIRYSFNKEKRVESRVPFKYLVNYPYINDKKINQDVDKLGSSPIEVIDISEYGIGFRSKVIIKENDFLSFYISVNDCIPFKCIIHIKWIGIDDSICYAGGDFIGMEVANRDKIREYITDSDSLEKK